MTRWGVLAVLIAAGCGGGGGGGGGGSSGTTALTITGGLPFTATSFAAVVGEATCPAAGTSFGLGWAAAIASNQGGICGYLQRNQTKAGVRFANLGVFHLDVTGAPTAVVAGVYPVVPSPVAQAMFALVSVSQNDSVCKPTTLVASGGRITVTTATAERIAGTVDATLPDGGTVTGSFDAPACAVTLPGSVCAGDVGPVDPACVP